MCLIVLVFVMAGCPPPPQSDYQPERGDILLYQSDFTSGVDGWQAAITAGYGVAYAPTFGSGCLLVNGLNFAKGPVPLKRTQVIGVMYAGKYLNVEADVLTTSLDVSSMAYGQDSAPVPPGAPYGPYQAWMFGPRFPNDGVWLHVHHKMLLFPAPDITWPITNVGLWVEPDNDVPPPAGSRIVITNVVFYLSDV